jgi:hypothetical protein
MPLMAASGQKREARIDLEAVSDTVSDTGLHSAVVLRAISAVSLLLFRNQCQWSRDYCTLVQALPPHTKRYMVPPATHPQYL